ncbi:hypothetical protein Hanom_Chr15g01386441 [Helianthus anomalus]
MGVVCTVAERWWGPWWLSEVEKKNWKRWGKVGSLEHMLTIVYTHVSPPNSVVPRGRFVFSRLNYKILLFIFNFLLNLRCCLLCLKLTSFIFNVSKICTLCPLGQTLLNFFVKVGHVPCT